MSAAVDTVEQSQFSGRRRRHVIYPRLQHMHVLPRQLLGRKRPAILSEQPMGHATASAPFSSLATASLQGIVGLRRWWSKPPIKSGSLITARDALWTWGREVLAVPGHPLRCARKRMAIILIRDGARLVRSAADISLKRIAEARNLHTAHPPTAWAGAARSPIFRRRHPARRRRSLQSNIAALHQEVFDATRSLAPHSRTSADLDDHRYRPSRERLWKPC